MRHRFNLNYVMTKSQNKAADFMAWSMVFLFSLACAEYGYNIGEIVGYPVHAAMIYYTFATYVGGNVVEVMQECP